MHHATLERIQISANPRIQGNLNVYFALVSLALSVAAPTWPAHLMILVCFLALGYDAAGRGYLQVLQIPIYFLIPSLLVLVVFTTGDPLVRVGSLVISDAGVARTIRTGFRSFASLSILGYLIVTTMVPEMFAALKRLQLPSFALEFALLTYRGIQLLMAESERLHTAAAARMGFVNRRALFRSTKLIAFSLFLKSLSRANGMERAMHSRGYEGRMPLPDRENSGYGYAGSVLTLVFITGWVV